MNLTPVLRQRFFDADGAPLSGGKLHTYQAGTTTPQATYTDQAGGTPHANPIILDANGEISANVWVNPALSYKFVLKNSSDVEQWTLDNVVGSLAADSVSTASIQDGAVTLEKLAGTNIVVGTYAQVTAGVASHSTWTAAIAAAASGDTVRGLNATWVENVTVTKQLQIVGLGYGTYINGSLTLNSSASHCTITGLRVNNDVTLDSGADANVMRDIFLPVDKTFVDNGDGNLLEGMQEV